MKLEELTRAFRGAAQVEIVGTGSFADSFGINNVALVDGQPRTLGLRELLTVYVDFFRPGKRVKDPR